MFSIERSLKTLEKIPETPFYDIFDTFDYYFN